MYKKLNVIKRGIFLSTGLTLMMSSLTFAGSVETSNPTQVKVEALASMIDIDLPLGGGSDGIGLSGVIDPNEKDLDKAFTTPVVTLKNESNFPLTVKVKITDGAQMKLVAPEHEGRTQEDWSKLDKIISKSEIALGLLATSDPAFKISTEKDNVKWFPAGGGFAGGSDWEFNITAMDELNLSLAAFHGMAFDTGVVFNYDIVFIVDLK